MTYENPTPETQDVVPSQDTNPQEDKDEELNKLLDSTNIAAHLKEEQLQTIGEHCISGFDLDKESRRDWEQDMEEWLKLAMQVREEKSYPWPKASNIKYPMLSTAAMQFQARAYPTLIPSNGEIVKAQVIGKDLDGQKEEKADRVSTYMSYQLLYDMCGWEEDMDKLLMMLPIVGTCFKKTFYDKSKDKVVSYLVSPKNLVVNYWATTLDDCERISEIIELSPRIVKERQLQGIFLDDFDFKEASIPIVNHDNLPSPVLDETTPHIFIEQHTFLDLDKDGYEEPYVVTIHLATRKVVRIVARYFQEDIQMDGNKIVKIEPRQYYTKYSFVPNPDGSFYSIGFGILLGPINEAINSLINQQIDGGTLSNMQSGFIGKGLRIKMGDTRFTPGEWKPVNAGADDLRKQIVPLPVKEPSTVLFQLMGSLITSGKELASVAEIFVGKMPGQNTPATTTMASIEQGMKVFTAVYKRVYRSLEEEFKKIFKLNSMYLDPNKYVNVLDMTVGPEDFDNSSVDICPAADPTAVSQTEKLVKAQGLMELMQGFGPLLNPVEVLTRILVAQEQPNYEKILAPQVAQTGQAPEPPPDPKILAIQAKAQAEQQKVAVQQQQAQQQAELATRSQQAQLAMKAQESQVKINTMQQEAQLKQKISAASEMQKIVQAQQSHQQGLVHTQQQHEQNLVNSKEKSTLAQKQNGQTGKPSSQQKPSSKK